MKLTKDLFEYDEGSDVLEIEIVADMNITGKDFYYGIRDQILENQEFVENYHKPYKLRVTYEKLKEDRDILKKKLEKIKSLTERVPFDMVRKDCVYWLEELKELLEDKERE